MAYWVSQGWVLDDLPWGITAQGTAFEFHPIVLLFVVHGCLMVSKSIHIPKPWLIATDMSGSGFRFSISRDLSRRKAWDKKEHEESIGNNTIYWIHWMHQLHIHTYEGNIYSMGIHMKMDRVENTVAHMVLTIAGWKKVHTEQQSAHGRSFQLLIWILTASRKLYGVYIRSQSMSFVYWLDQRDNVHQFASEFREKVRRTYSVLLVDIWPGRNLAYTASYSACCASS